MTAESKRSEDAMKIIYHQTKSAVGGSLELFGVKNCYFKSLQMDRD